MRVQGAGSTSSNDEQDDEEDLHVMQHFAQHDREHADALVVLRVRQQAHEGDDPDEGIDAAHTCRDVLVLSPARRGDGYVLVASARDAQRGGGEDEHREKQVNAIPNLPRTDVTPKTKAFSIQDFHLHPLSDSHWPRGST